MTLGDRVCVLRDGRLQQVDTPQTLFDPPVNLFVAGFIGSPAMNFVTAELVRDGGPAVTFAGYKLPVPARRLRGQARPRGLLRHARSSSASGRRTSRTQAWPTAGWGKMPVTANVTEELGSEIHVIFTIDAPPVEHASHRPRRPDRDEDDDESVSALAGGKSLWTARVSARSQRQARAADRARRRHAQPPVLRPGQRPVHRPPEGHRRAGRAQLEDRPAFPGSAGSICTNRRELAPCTIGTTTMATVRAIVVASTMELELELALWLYSASMASTSPQRPARR